jgi:hypothetical protein
MAAPTLQARGASWVAVAWEALEGAARATVAGRVVHGLHAIYMNGLRHKSRFEGGHTWRPSPLNRPPHHYLFNPSPPGARAYELQSRGAAEVTWSLLGEVTGTVVRKKNLVPGTDYYFRVRPVGEPRNRRVGWRAHAPAVMMGAWF